MEKIKSLNHKAAYLLVALVFILVFLGVFGDHLNSLLEYDKVAIERGEYWRFFSSSFVHLGVIHLVINLAALFLGIFLYHHAKISFCFFIPILAFHIIFTNLFTYFFSPESKIVLGMSAALYGFVIFTLLVNTFKNSWLYILPTFVVIARVLLQQREEFDTNHIKDYVQAPVFVEGHLYGLYSGLILFAVFLLFQWLERK